MSVRNQSQYATLAIKSILNQSFSDFEFIIINDASTDTTSQLLKRIKDPRVKVITNPRHLGLTRSLNLGISQSQGEFIARMDADDIALPHRFKVQSRFLKHHPAVAVCGTAANLINASGKKIGSSHYPVKISQSILMRYNPLIHPSVMFRRSVIQTQGDYDNKLDGAEDYDLWLRLGARYQIANINQPLLSYRINPQGISWKHLKHTELQSIKARFKALKHYNYPLWQAVFLIKPLLSFLIPGRIKKLLFNIK